MGSHLTSLLYVLIRGGQNSFAMFKKKMCPELGGGGEAESKLVIPYKFNLHSFLDVNPI